MSLFSQMKTEVERVAAATKKAEKPLFTNYTDDFYVIDREIIEEDAQADDRYIWIIKGNGCGTYLIRCGSSMSLYLLKETSDDSRFYQVDVTGINEGKLIALRDKEHALRIAEGTHNNPDRIPRRYTLQQQLNKLLGYDDRQSPLRHHVISSELNLDERERAVLCITPGNIHANVTVLRSKIPDNKPAAKPSATYMLPMTHRLLELQSNAPKHYYLLVGGKSGHATAEPATSKLFLAAQRSINKAAEAESQVESEASPTF